jgi:cytochrome c-type biogenesis protein CcmH/NrfG
MFDMDSIIDELVEKLAELTDKIKITKESGGVVVRFTDPSMNPQVQDATNLFSAERLAGLKKMIPSAADLDFDAEPMDDGFKLKTKDPDGTYTFISKLLDPEALVRMLRQAMPESTVKSAKEKRFIEELKRKTDEHPDSFDAWIELADAYLQVNEFDDADDCMQKATSFMPEDMHDPKFAKVCAIGGKYHTLKGTDNPEECIFGNLISVALNRQEPSAWYYLGVTYMIGNQPGLALCAFETAEKLCFKDAEGLAKAKKEAKAKLGSASYDAKKTKADIDQRVEDTYQEGLKEFEEHKESEKRHAEFLARAAEEKRVKEEAAAAKKKAKEEAAAKKKAAAKAAAAAKPAKAAATKPAAEPKPAAAKPAGKKKK